MYLPQAAENLAQRYERQAVLRALVQLIPFNMGSAIDTAVLTRLQTVRAERAREFFDELAKNESRLTPELLESNEFLHCFYTTSEAALRTSQFEKIRMFARLLSESMQQGMFSDIDEYEELLGILIDLSNRELTVLILVNRYETAYPKIDGENELQRANRYWDSLVLELSRTLSVPSEEVDSILLRLNRSGCYETFTGTYWDYTGGKGKTTPLYRRIKSIALDAD
ncbi:hypothetical protein OYT1_ch0715 [Ferriphaselus amnicola]|uniref:Uncharacterized protein n=1 Tax=Ferriphaselus amnicola TaxID=1188319 RepID=A0A2Z6GA04_9PROT|nr:hypothetical protein [Ferriphaselus amnicola]BBE50282.1 hypothetical protein OYT1_ch0715 [Ferriphaselus amnicola]